MSTAMFVVVLVAAILGAQLIGWLSVLAWFRRRRQVIAGRLNSELATETVIRPPEPGSYRGSTIADYPIVNNDGMIALTPRRLIFQTLTGKVIEVSVTHITGVREAEVFKSAAKGGRQHLIIQTASGEVGFLVRDNAAWIASLIAVAGRSLAVGESTADSLGEAGSELSESVRTRRGTTGILAVAFTSVGLLVGLVAAVGAAVIAVSISGDRSVDGTVVDLSHNGKSYRPVVEFVLPESAPVRFTSWVGSNPPAFDVGEQVRVRYNPDNPQDAVIDTYWQIWFVPTLIGIIAAPFLGVGIALGAGTLKARRQISRGRDIRP